MRPGDDALKAMPGDVLTYLDMDGSHQVSTVKTAGWQPSPKGGKVWTYELVDGSLVPNDAVLKVEKGAVKNSELAVLPLENPKSTALHDVQYVLGYVEESVLPSTIKTAIHCLVQGDLKHLEVAQFLVNERIKQLSELNKINSPMVGL